MLATEIATPKMSTADLAELEAAGAVVGVAGTPIEILGAAPRAVSGELDASTGLGPGAGALERVEKAVAGRGVAAHRSEDAGEPGA